MRAPTLARAVDEVEVYARHRAPTRLARLTSSASFLSSVLFSVALLTGCGASAAARPQMEYPGALVAPASVKHEFSWRQHVDARARGRTHSFDAVLEHYGDEITLLALTPYGSRGLLLRQVGEDVETKKFVDFDLPFPPKSILIDVHRAYFRQIPGAPLPDGPHVAVDHQENIREVWAGGRLMSREYTRDSGPPGVIRIDYEGGWAPGATPPKVTLNNGWFQYELTIETTPVE